MNDKAHFWISIFKSNIRIGAAIVAAYMNNLLILCIGLGIAELLGIAEEIFDKRK